MTHFSDALPSAIVKRDEPLAKWTSIRIGGPAEVLVCPRDTKEVIQVLALCRAEGHKVSILGGGANTLVGDLGVDGVTLKLQAGPASELVHYAESVGNYVSVSGGTAIARVVTLMRQQQKTGLEFLAGIPGTVGGAVAMNAGTKNGECMKGVIDVELATADGDGWFGDLKYSYRKTILPPGAIVTRVRFRLTEGPLAFSESSMAADLAYRKATQPLSQPNFGSVFTNPPGQFAGALIEQVGLKGHRIGQAQFSEKHANWIVNLRGASAAEVVALMDLATLRVFEQTGIRLHPEVTRIGRFGSMS